MSMNDVWCVVRLFGNRIWQRKKCRKLKREIDGGKSLKNRKKKEEEKAGLVAEAEAGAEAEAHLLPQR